MFFSIRQKSIPNATNANQVNTGEITMKNQEMFVSVEECTLESVAGGLLDIANGALNNNTINLLSGICVSAVVGDVLSHILNIGNEVG